MQATAWHFLYWYVIYPHPIYWLYQRTLEYDFIHFDKGVWFVIAIFGIAAWFGLTRYLAETPGRLYGNMYMWWLIFSILHFWSIPIYVIYVLIGRAVRHRRKAVKVRELSDRPKSQIYADAWEEKRIAQASRAKRGGRRKRIHPRIR